METLLFACNGWLDILVRKVTLTHSSKNFRHRPTALDNIWDVGYPWIVGAR